MSAFFIYFDGQSRPENELNPTLERSILLYLRLFVCSFTATGRVHGQHQHRAPFRQLATYRQLYRQMEIA